MNADNTAFLGATRTALSCNIFAYCENNPVANVDYEGTYSVKKALNYADRWWNGFNSNYRSYGQDCANFVSQCLYAGGFSKMTDEWHNKKVWKRVPIIGIKYKTWSVGAAWRLSNQLRWWLINEMHYTQHIFTDKISLKKYIKNVHPGDVAFVSSDYNGNPAHTVLIGRVTKNNIYYYGHTKPRTAKSSDYGLMDYFNDKPKNKTAMVIIIHLA